MQPDLGNIKGLVIRQFLGWYVERYGATQAAAALDAMPTADREQIDLRARGFGILPTRWYPALFVHRMLDAAIEPVRPTERTQVAREAAHAIINASISGIYKTLFRLIATPERYIRYQQKVWDQHYDSGTITVEPITETSERITTRDWRGHHPFSCQLNGAAAIPIHENMGKKNVQQERVSCISTGGEACVDLISWND